MISVSGRRWEQKKIDKNSLEKLKQDYDFSEIVSKIILSRKFDETEITSINHRLKLNNVFLNNNDFKKSIQIIVDCINNKENICILGDYDVDGSAATSLIIRFLESIKHPHFYYIPDRIKDGYGPSKKLFQKLILKNPKLMIMVDCGSTSNEAIDFLNNNNIKSIIIDHHEIYKPFPKANTIINPKKDNGYLEYDYLCATTLVYFFLDLISLRIKSKFKLSNYLIYVLLATVCDVMPIRKLNRIIALNALKNFDLNSNVAFKELFGLLNKKNKLNINDLGYFIGPILNSGGRLGNSNYASDLLSSNNLQIIKTKSKKLIELNNKRKKIENLIINEIDFKKIQKEDKKFILYYKANLNEGLIGIIAARLKDHFNKPSIVITKSNKILKGSARSVSNYNIGRVIKKLKDDDIIISGGGHNMAAGFSLKSEKLKKFENFINSDLLKNKFFNTSNFKYDAEVSSSALNQDFYSDLKKLEPFGTGNQAPIFLLKDLKIIKSWILSHSHISLILKSKSGLSIKAISFNSVKNKIGECLLNYKKNLNVLGQINENYWDNKKTLQLTIKDVIL
jgi:single-stranded-DNA-specific exonuclease